MANKTKKEACARPGRGGRSKHYSGRGRPRGGRRRKLKEQEENGGEEEVEGEEMGEADKANEEQQPLPCVKKQEEERTEECKTSRGNSKQRRVAGACSGSIWGEGFVPLLFCVARRDATGGG